MRASKAQQEAPSAWQVIWGLFWSDSKKKKQEENKTTKVELCHSYSQSDGKSTLSLLFEGGLEDEDGGMDSGLDAQIGTMAQYREEQGATDSECELSDAEEEKDAEYTSSDLAGGLRGIFTRRW